MSNPVQEIIDMPREFWRDGIQFINRSQKPDRKEFLSLCKAVATGFLVMGFVGYFVKLAHIPINNVLVGAA